MKDRLKEVSIRGRVAYGITCLEIYFAHLGLLNQPVVFKFLDTIWQFTSSNSLDEWEEAVMDYSPRFVEKADVSEVTLLTAEEFEQIRQLYDTLPSTLLEMIEEVIEIGRGNLYAGTTGYSEHTYTPTIHVIKLMQRKGLPLPALEPFEQSCFSESHGWGYAREREFFKQ